MLPEITVTDPLHAAIVARALVDHARALLKEAGDIEQNIVSRLRLVRTARIALQLAEAVVPQTPNLSVEYPEDYDAQLLVWLHSMV